MRHIVSTLLLCITFFIGKSVHAFSVVAPPEVLASDMVFVLLTSDTTPTITQRAGSPVSFTYGNGGIRFRAPSVENPDVVRFDILVGKEQQEIAIRIVPLNRAPIIEIAPFVRTQIRPLETVVLSAHAYDDDGTVVDTYWRSIGAKEASLTNVHMGTALFQAPFAVEAKQVQFIAHAIDNDSAQSTRAITVSVLPDVLWHVQTYPATAAAATEYCTQLRQHGRSDWRLLSDKDRDDLPLLKRHDAEVPQTVWMTVDTTLPVVITIDDNGTTTIEDAIYAEKLPFFCTVGTHSAFALHMPQDAYTVRAGMDVVLTARVQQRTENRAGTMPHILWTQLTGQRLHSEQSTEGNLRVKAPDTAIDTPFFFRATLSDGFSASVVRIDVVP